MSTAEESVHCTSTARDNRMFHSKISGRLSEELFIPPKESFADFFISNIFVFSWLARFESLVFVLRIDEVVGTVHNRGSLQ